MKIEFHDLIHALLFLTYRARIYAHGPPSVHAKNGIFLEYHVLSLRRR